MPIFLQTIILGLILFLSVPFGAMAQAPAQQANSGVSPGQAQQAPEGKFIQDLGDKAIAIIADKTLTPEQRSTKYSDLLHKAFDIPTIGHFVLGRAWNTATPEQQNEYLKLFESLMIKIYGDRLNFYSGESFRVKGVRHENDNDTVVNSEVVHPQGEAPTPIDWRLRNAHGQLSIVDVTVDGVSQSVTQRQEYASILERNNGNIDALLKLMQERVAKPDAGSPPS